MSLEQKGQILRKMRARRSAERVTFDDGMRYRVCKVEEVDGDRLKALLSYRHPGTGDRVRVWAHFEDIEV